MDSKFYQNKLKETLEKDKLSYGFYNFNLEQKDLIIVGQNPGGFGKNEEEKIKLINNPEKLVNIYRGVLIDYFNDHEKMKSFWKKFFETLNKELNLNINPKEFFNEKSVFYTDIIKKRGNIKSISKEDWEEIFKSELNVVNPKLIICFGRISWDFFKEKYPNLKRIGDKKEANLGNITKEHGYLFKTPNGKYIIPLIHYSGNSYPKCPRESYWDYFEKGLNEYLKISSNSNTFNQNKLSQSVPL
jgi:hypothetical protein